MEAVTVSGQIRTDLGKKSTKAVRKAGEIPAVIYSKAKNVHFSTTHKAVKSLVFTPAFKLAEVELDGKAYRCIVKDIQWHPVTDEIIHIDFLQLLEDEPVKIELPVRFTGVAPGMRAGGKLQQLMRRIKAKAIPANIVSELVLDISSLELGQSIRVRDITPAEGVEIMSPPSAPVGIIEVPRALRSAASAAEKEGAGAAVEADGDAEAEAGE